MAHFQREVLRVQCRFELMVQQGGLQLLEMVDQFITLKKQN